MTTIGVLCARVRVEEKQLLAALGESGVFAAACSPADAPLPIGPLPTPLDPPPAGAAAAARFPFAPAIFIDRCQDRAIAAVVVAAYRALGVPTLDAGLAATGDRLAIAAALSRARLPRPETRVTCSATAALLALSELGYPSTLLPIAPGAPVTWLLDVDVAEAVLEHRAVLGSAHEAVALIQAGVPRPTERVTVVVVGGRAVATIATVAKHPVVWDVHPVPEFRHAIPLGTTTVAAALAASALARLVQGNGHPTRGERVSPMATALAQPHWSTNGQVEVGNGASLTA